MGIYYTYAMYIGIFELCGFVDGRDRTAPTGLQNNIFCARSQRKKGPPTL